MINNLLSRTPLHRHDEPAQRLLGVGQLPPDSAELAHLLAADAAPQVRIAAAQRCTVIAALAAAWTTEADSAVKAAIASALGIALALAEDSACARETLEADQCTDEIRADVVRRAQDPERRRVAIDCIRDEGLLVEVALGAERAEARMAAAQRVSTLEGLQKLAAAAKDKDRGVARLARQRIDAMNNRLWQQAEAQAIIGQLEALAAEPGAILTAVVELDRRWQALDMTGDPACLERYGAARGIIQARFDREHEAQRARAQFERRLREWFGALGLAGPDAMAGLHADLAALRADAQQRGDRSALSQLDEAEQRIRLREEEHQALAGAQALVLEAEHAAEASIGSAELLARWRALTAALRTPVLTRRFEAALLAIEKRRLDQAQAAKQEAIARRHRFHGLLHAAEQALAAGQLQAARAAADGIKPLKTGAGDLPKPTTQRLARLLQALAELERWESFGQRNARIQLCERAQALAAQTLDAPKIALEVRKLRDEWKALDQQHAGVPVPRALWERFDAACEKAYAPAAKHYAELAARNKEARRRREEFIAGAAAHALTLLGGDWREIERWLRETDRTWREGDLGSVNPDAWKKLDARLKAALAPLRDALSAARDQAVADRKALIEEARALSSKAMERDSLGQIKAIQARWQEQAKALPLKRRDEGALWEQFRVACDAVFSARQSKRREEDAHKREAHRALEDICAKLEQLAQAQAAAEKDDQAVRRTVRELQEQWNRSGSGPALRDLELRFRKAGIAVEAMLSARAKSRGAAVWKTLAAKERLCDALDSLAQSGVDAAESATVAIQEQWLALPALPAAWEQKMMARRDGALRALSDAAAGSEYLARIEHGAESRRESLVELELSLGLDSPAECQAQRLALQVKQLKERFKGPSTTGSDTPGERLLAWCARPGVSGTPDQQRCERVFSEIEKTRARTQG